MVIPHALNLARFCARPLAAAALSLTLVGLLAPFTAGADAPPTPADRSQRSPLSGPPQPALTNPDAPPTIIRLGETGLIERTPQPPESAAAAKLALSEEVREKISAIFARRAAILDAFVADNLDLLTKFATAAATNDKADQLRLLSEAAGKLRPILLDRPLSVQITQALPESQTNTFGVMLEDYWDAVVKEVQAAEKTAKAKPRGRFAIIAEERIKGLGREIEAAFQRQIYSGDLLYRVVTRDVTLTGEQAASIRELTREYAERTKGNPSNQDNVQLFLRIAALVDVDTQVKMIRNVQAVFGGGPAKPAQAAQPAKAGPAGTPPEAGQPAEPAEVAEPAKR